MKNNLKYFLLTTILMTLSSVVSFAQKAYYCLPCNSSCDTIAFTQPGKCPYCGMELLLMDKKEHDEKMKQVRVLFYLQDGVEALDFAGPMEVFTDAGFKVSVVSKTKEPILSQGVLKIIPEYSIADAPPAEIVAFFGGSTDKPSNDPDVIKWLNSLQSPHYYFSVCTGAFFLAKAGMLDGLTATTFHSAIDKLQSTAPKARVLANTRFVDNGKVITTAGISAGIDGALHLVSKIRGQEYALTVAKEIEYDKWVPEQGLIVNKP